MYHDEPATGTRIPDHRPKLCFIAFEEIKKDRCTSNELGVFEGWADPGKT